jgi:tol-pal system protein YbgF
MPMTKPPFALATTFLLVWLAGGGATAFAQSRADRQMMADIRMLQEQSQQLAISLAALNESINQALKAINTRIDQQTEATRKGLADQKLIVDNIGSDLRVIRERTDETNVSIGTLNQEIEALRTSMAQMQTAQPVPGAVPTPEGTPPTPGVTPPPSTIGLSPTRMYEQAFADYGGGQWSLAITGFEAFIKTFPKAEQADDAQFYIGETFAAMGRHQDAIAAYNQVIQNYPSSNSVPLAYFKRGSSQDRLDQKDAARASWEFVVKTYPDSEAALLAKQSLDRIARKPGA